MKNLFLTILLVYSINSFSQIVWEEIYTPDSVQPVTICFDNENDAFLGTTGGVYYSSDNCATWEYIGLSGKKIYSLAINQENNLLAGALHSIYLYNQTSGSLKHVYSTISTGYSNSRNANILDIEPGFNGTVFAGGTVARSLDSGYTWNEIAFPSDLDEVDFAIKSEDTVYYGGTKLQPNEGGAWISIDNGETWEHIGLENHFLKVLETNSAGDLYAGGIGHYFYGYGGLYKYSVESNTWDTLRYSPSITSMVFTEEDIFYCGYRTSETWGGVMHTEDDGETWVNDSEGMGNEAVRNMALDKNERLYIRAGYGTYTLFRSSLPVSIERQSELKPKKRTYCVPNPFSSRAKIYFDKPPKGSADLQFNLYSHGCIKAVTRALSSNEVDQAIILIDRNNLTKGIYSYTISGASYYCAGRFIIN